ncbi:PP2C family serine/threonine-protein phosphatase [Schaalia hyovaginalis]|uniref:Protein phosphatase n=1 Tax=Schaalia hyovaginalis TaxID=29316 RepID=A0A923E0K9_9ACTO|nr:PP2C family serine/threonine-protein phosphatase [Schaalia hyovaginalis]MBB6333699.1 protein phosphatase [Schaalia hyovaginalis]MDY2668568.1 PP2C family serine/threonine-protein phosphatase [Schaalia hyovaginalis]
MALPLEFHYAARSDVGLVRSNNQDSGYAGANLLVLADGMGGPAGGDIASSVALAHLVPLDTDSHTADTMLPLLRDALMDAHEELSDRSHRDKDLEGLGTTCIALMRSGNKLAMVHIGDSRAYLLRGEALTQVTTDHSFVQYLIESGQITPEEAEHHPNRNVVLRILGDSQADVTPDETIREAVLGDRWLLCSDGLSGVVSPETIGMILTTVEDPGECAEELIRLALRAGGPDNITCVVADVVAAGAFPPEAPQIVGAAAIDRHAASRGGSGAAARAAALRRHRSLDLDDDADEEPAAPKHRFAPLLALLATALVIGGAWLGWAWTQMQYYAIGQEGYVVIHQGIPQSLGPWEFSHAVEVTDIALADLKDVDRQRLEDPVIRSSRAEIDAYIDQLRLSKSWVSSNDEPESGAQSASRPGTGAQSGETKAQ